MKRILRLGNFNISMYRKAFTLAEVLITLVIIGVVAAMTIPVLLNSIQDQQYKTGYKKAVSVASQAWTNVSANNLDVYNTNFDTVSTNTNWLAFKSQFQIVKDCNNNNNHDCWDFNGEKYGPSVNCPDSTYPSFVDNSGMSWTRLTQNTMEISVDTNGLKPPNKMGKDRWMLLMETIDNQYTGNLVKVQRGYTGADVVSINSWECPSPPCYYQSWLTGDK